MKKMWNGCLACLLAAFVSGCASSGGSGGSVKGANVFVTRDHHPGIRTVAVLPFRAPTELIGASVSDLFVTELLRTGRYDLIERSQLSNILGEAEIALSGLTAQQAAQVGKMAGADAVIIGTVSEYEMLAHRGHTLPVVGINVRLIDTNTSRVLWSVDHAAGGSKGSTLAQQSRVVASEMVSTLQRQIR